MQANEYAIIERAIEEGIRQGWRRAHKHTECPNEQVVFEALENSIMSNICEVFFFASPFEDDDDDEPPGKVRIGLN